MLKAHTELTLFLEGHLELHLAHCLNLSIRDRLMDILFVFNFWQKYFGHISTKTF